MSAIIRFFSSRIIRSNFAYRFAIASLYYLAALAHLCTAKAVIKGHVAVTHAGIRYVVRSASAASLNEIDVEEHVRQICTAETVFVYFTIAAVNGCALGFSTRCVAAIIVVGFIFQRSIETFIAVNEGLTYARAVTVAPFLQ